MCLRSIVLVSAALALVAGTASAQTTEPVPTAVDAAESRPTRWYGWQTLLADAASITMFLGSSSASTTGAEVALVGYAAGGPAIHFAHSQWSSGLGSLGLRFGLPLVGFYTGAAIAGPACPASQGRDPLGCGLGYMVGGVLFGGLAAVVLDATVLAYEPAKATRGAWVAPSLAFDKERAAVTLSGQF
jgi:hypothetical protein